MKYVLFFACLVLTACTIQVKMNGAVIPENLKSFSVDYFQNRSAIIHPTLSQKFTEDLQTRIESESRLIYSNKSDINFSGDITDYSTRPVAIGADALAQETRLSMTVKVVCKNSKEPKKNWNQSFTAFRDFQSSRNINEVEDELIEELVKELTENIFNKAFSDW